MERWNISVVQYARLRDRLQSLPLRYWTLAKSSFTVLDTGKVFLLLYWTLGKFRCCFKDNVGETFEKRGGAHMGFSERIDTILN